MSSEIFYTFGKKAFAGGILVEVIGLVLFSLNFMPGPHKIFLIPLITGLMFMALGIRQLLKSFKRPHCIKCQLEFKEEAEVSCRKDDENNLKQAIESNDAAFLSSIEVIRNDAKPRCEIEFEYCPKCQEIGLISVKAIDGTKKQILKDRPIRGEFIKSLKEAFLI